MHVQSAANREEESIVSHSEEMQQVRHAETKQGELCRYLDCLQSHEGVRLFQFISSKYLNIGDMSVERQRASATRWSVKRKIASTEQSPRFLTCYQKGSCSFPLFTDAPPNPQQLLTGS